MLIDGDPDNAPAPDTLSGGPGSVRDGGYDTVDYTARSVPLRIDLLAQKGGAAGEGDKLESIEKVLAGRGDDVLLGGPQNEVLDGGGGTDFIAGRPGDDQITVGDGGQASGGPGDERFVVRKTAKITCGTGRDETLELRPSKIGPEFAPDCEQLGRDPGFFQGADTPTGLYVDPRARIRRRLIRFSVRCGDCARGRLTVTSIRHPIRILARSAFRLRLRDHFYDYAGTASVSLPADLAQRARGRKLRFILRSDDGQPGFARPYRTVWTIRVAPPR